MPVKWTRPKKAETQPEAEKPNGDKPKAEKQLKAEEPKGDKPNGKGRKGAR